MDARAPWFVAGSLIGLVIVGRQWLLAKPLGALGGFVDLHDWARRPASRAGWRRGFS